MSNAAPLIVLAAIAIIMAIVIGCMMYVAGRDRNVRGEAEKRIAEAARRATRSASGGEVVFRKPRRSGCLFLVLFLLILGVSLHGLRFADGSVNRAGRPFTTFSARIEILFSLPFLAIAVWQWKYKVRVSDRELSITGFTTRVVRLRDIDEVTIGAYRATPYCQIRVNNGDADLSVESNLEGFLDFVSLLSENVQRSKARMP